jgi:hypothetical protein
MELGPLLTKLGAWGGLDNLCQASACPITPTAYDACDVTNAWSGGSESDVLSCRACRCFRPAGWSQFPQTQVSR